MSLKRTINEHVLKESDIDHRPAQDLCYVSTDRDAKSDEGETPQESKGEKLSLESSFPGSPPKCFTPRRQSPPKFEISLDHVDKSSLSSCDDSSQPVGSVLSISSLLNGKFGSAYKKRKIRQKVEAVMGSVESVCLEQGEILRDVVAQSCLFRRKKTFNGINGKEVIWHVFSEVANELGVRKAFCELVPEELWNQRVQMMSVPDWMLLLCKLESTISDDSWQMILNQTRLGKSRVS